MMPINEPQLAPPGAGLPPVELFIARLLFGLRSRTGTHAAFTQKFVQERQKIAALIQSCDPATGSQRALISRPPGLEDSSRYWSVWMTLDHLRIVHVAFARLIGALRKGQVPPGMASTAAVKPSPDADAAVVAPYEASCDALLAAGADADGLKTEARYAHPWFGPMTAWQWYALAGTHMGLHRVQIERILAQISKSK